jgi:hypothetical protein
MAAPPPYEVPVEAVHATIPDHEVPDTAFPAHLDINRDGMVDVEIPRPEARLAGGMVNLTIRPRALHDTVLEVSAGLVRKEGYSQAVQLVADDAGVWTGQIPANARGEIVLGGGLPYRTTIKVGSLLVYVDVVIGVRQDPDGNVA